MTKHIKSAVAVLAVISFGLLAIGSSPPQPMYDSQPVPIYNGFFVNDDLLIEAEDESFSIRGGDTFRTPFSVDSWNHPVQSFNIQNDQTTLGSWDQALKLGAKNVKVWQKGRSKPLYGVLMFSDVFKAAVGPGARSYQLQIPQSRLDSAAKGNLTWVGEKVDFKYRYNTSSYTGFKYSWVLWLGNTPFRDSSVPAPMTRAEREAAAEAARIRAEAEAQRRAEAEAQAQQANRAVSTDVAEESETKNPIEALGNTLKGLFGNSSSSAE